MSIQDQGLPEDRMFSRQLLLIPLLCAVGAMIPTAVTHADDSGHIKILKEVLYERGISAIPNAMSRAPNGDLVIAGFIGGKGWATRIAANGQVLWRYIRSEKEQNRSVKSSFAGAVLLKDESAVLCGKIYVGNRAFAQVTRISKEGAVLSDESLDSPEDKSVIFSDLRHCVAYRDGAAAIGIALGPDPGQTAHAPSHRLVFLDANAHRYAEHSLSVPGTLLEMSGDGQSVTLQFVGSFRAANADIHITSRVMRLDSSGAILGDRTIEGGGYLVHGQLDSALGLLLEPAAGLQFHRLGQNYGDLSVVTGPKEHLIPTRTWFLDNGSLVSFGHTDVGGSSSASVTWLSPNLRDKQIVMFKPLFTAFKVDAAVSSGRDGEFMAARGINPRGIPGSQDDPTGLLLTTISIN
jgi:hypothetical protein